MSFPSDKLKEIFGDWVYSHPKQYNNPFLEGCAEIFINFDEICYDYRTPAQCRNRYLRNYDRIFDNEHEIIED